MARYQAQRAPDATLCGLQHELPNERERFGNRRLFLILRREGKPSGINLIYRLHLGEGLTVRKQRARSTAVGTRAPDLGLGPAPPCTQCYRGRHPRLPGADPGYLDL